MKIFKQLFLLLLALFLTVTAYTQVTIGSGLKPKDGAILDLKQEHKPDGSANSKKGLGMPRVALLALDQLEPCAETNVANMKAHVGLMVYNTNDNTSTIATLREGMYLWDGQNWMPVGKKDIQGFGPWHQVDNPTLPARTETTNSYLNAKAVIGGKEILDDAQLSVYGNTVIKGQATVGSEFAPTRAALFELKEKQSLNPSNVGETESATSGGFLLPRVNLVSTSTLEPFIPITDPDWDGGAKEKELKLSLVGLMVYNIKSDGTNLYPGIYSWNGGAWVTSQANPSKLSIATEPKQFSFYETGIAADKPMEALRFVVNSGTDINGNPIPVTYQWYEMVGSNRNARVGKALTSATDKTNGSQTFAFTPNNLLKGSTINANNTGFYKFYCIATDDFGASVTSEIVEIAVGCGAKNNNGDWITFMCFNLGAGENIGTSTYRGISIEEQRNYNIGAFTNNDGGVSGNHAYIQNEEVLWGDTFQWGRISDGHEKRTSDIISQETLTSADFGRGDICQTSSVQRYPMDQVKPLTQGEGKFVIAPIIATAKGDWNLAAAGSTNILWSRHRSIVNDPCSKLNIDGTYREWWSTGVGSDACSDGKTGWKMPSAEDYGEIYKGGTIAGLYPSSTANTWIRVVGTVSNRHGYHEVQPDGETSTLIFPLNGYRHGGNGALRFAGEIGYYQTSSQDGSNSLHMNIGTSINPAYSSGRAYGYGVRCVKSE